eukprot:TRINITY_DN1868_c0_g1_i1.p1 TRINITY_DN1868_c0_g1~~TRINITY_DN1868_c0_g1_i1.p1  ORF type:complete len:1012 (-),score=224.63 TRINITY_DN1868_c0_g1_i1:177-3212(-)
MDPVEQVYITLGFTLASSGEQRKNAELQVEAFSKQPGYASILTQILVNPDLALPTRQLAGILLKQLARKSWMEAHVTTQDRAFVRQHILRSVSDPSKKIRNATAMAIAAISTMEFPEGWPTLFQDLRALLSSSNAHAVDGALKTLGMILPEASVEQTPEVVQVMLPELFQLIAADQQLEGRAVRAMSVVASTFKMINHMTEVKAAREIMKSILPNWVQVFVTILGANDSRDVMFNLKGETLQCISCIFADFPKLVKPYMDTLLPVLWNCMTSGYACYERQVIFNPEYEIELADSDGESCGIESYIGHLFAALQSVFESNGLRKTLEPSLLPLVQILIGFMQLSDSQMETAAEDPNQFVADEDDDALTSNVRTMAQSLLQGMFDGFDKKLFPTLSHAVSTRIRESQEKLQAGDANWWRLREAAVLAISTLAEEINTTGQEAYTALNLSEFFSTILTTDLSPSAPPFLKSRAINFTSKFISILPPQQAKEFLPLCLSALEASQPFHLRMAACRMTYRIATKLPASDMKGIITPLCQSVCQLISLTNNDTFHIVLETLTAVLKVDAEASASIEPSLTPFILNLWMSQPTDPLMSVNVIDIVEALAKIPECRPSLYQRCFPILTQSLSQTQQLGVVETVVELAIALVKHHEGEIAPIVLDSFFPQLITTMLNSEDHALLQSGAHFLMAIVRLGSPILVERKDVNGVSYLHHILGIVAKLLDPSVDESAAIFVGALVSKLVMKYGELLGSSVNQMLEACVRRLASAKLLSLIQSLLLVFCRLIHSHGLSILDFLSTLTVGDTNALNFVLTTWANNQSSFYGDYEIKVSLTALMKILQSRDARLMTIMVQGDPILTDGRRKTRSSKASSEQYTSIPFMVKILHLLVDQFSIELLNSQNVVAEDSAHNDDDDDDYEDEDDEDDLPGFDEFRPHGVSGVFAPADDYIDLMNAAHFEDDDESDSGEDPDAKQDPLYSVDLKVHIQQAVQSLSYEEQQQFLTVMQGNTERQKTSLQILGRS